MLGAHSERVAPLGATLRIPPSPSETTKKASRRGGFFRCYWRRGWDRYGHRKPTWPLIFANTVEPHTLTHTLKTVAFAFREDISKATQ